MGIEIERKFLVEGDTWRAAVTRSVPMRQAYLNSLDDIDAGRSGASVRVRIEGDTARLNLKSRELGRSRQEFDYPIPIDDACALMRLAVGAVVAKTRYFVGHAGHVWEIDVFEGENSGLVVAEIELDAEDAAFPHPPWLGREVTHLPRYYNLAIATRPYSRWSEAEQSAHDAEPGD